MYTMDAFTYSEHELDLNEAIKLLRVVVEDNIIHYHINKCQFGYHFQFDIVE